MAGNSVIYDGVFMDQLVALFVSMSGSKARALRYSSCCVKCANSVKLAFTGTQALWQLST